MDLTSLMTIPLKMRYPGIILLVMINKNGRLCCLLRTFIVLIKYRTYIWIGIDNEPVPCNDSINFDLILKPYIKVKKKDSQFFLHAKWIIWLLLLLLKFCKCFKISLQCFFFLFLFLSFFFSYLTKQ